MISLLHEFIKAERTGDWKAHLQTVAHMLPYFAASGHNLYAKSAYVYLQSMRQLETTHPDVHEAFMKGHHIIRRSDRYWAGLSTDLVIEQVLMRSVKATGGMTRGRGMSENQRVQWLLSMPACSGLNHAMQELTSVQYHSSEQHKEGSISRMKRDQKDKMTFLSFLKDRNPFAASDGSALRNIETGVTSESNATVDDARNIGNEIVESMKGHEIFSYSFKRANKAVPMNTKSTVVIENESVHVDPQLLFQRLIAASNNMTEDKSDIFRYELTSYPTSIFDSTGLPRVAQKASLADAIWNMGDCSATIDPNTCTKYVLDGGALIHRIPWTRGSTFSSICQLYTQYVLSRYGRATVVFDGYISGPSTKDCTHIRRSHGIIGTRVHFSESTPFRTKKETFLSNMCNKQRFIELLSAKLRETNCSVVNAEADADCLLVQTALECSTECPTVLIGEDTDLLVLLLYHFDSQLHRTFFVPFDTRSSKSKLWDIQKTKSLLGDLTCRLLPFVYAITGCDTVSRMFGVGKASVLKRIKADSRLQELAKIFLNPAATATEIVTTGEELICAMYKGVPHEGLNVLRFRRFACKAVMGTVVLQVHTLPPTSAAATHHNKRTYYQVQQWIGNAHRLDPLDWGWIKDSRDLLMPMKTNLPPAPQSLLKVIRCNCKTGCDSARCICRKLGLECTNICGECRGVSCSNGQRAESENDD